MREITVKECKHIQLVILKELKRICIKENITYYLGYGTLLGAVRHKGFIPWDDDIDVLMPREDYLRFLDVAVSSVFELLHFEKCPRYPFVFAKASAPGTLVSENGRRGSFAGVAVDIFPIDGMGDSLPQAVRHFNSLSLGYGLYIAGSWKKYIKGRTSVLRKKVLRLGSFILSRFTCHSRVLSRFNKKIQIRPFNKSAFVAVCCSPYGVKEVMNKDVYGQGAEAEFEGELFSVPADSHAYLTAIFGDYMQLPPKEKRVRMHDSTSYRL